MKYFGTAPLLEYRRWWTEITLHLSVFNLTCHLSVHLTNLSIPAYSCRPSLKTKDHKAAQRQDKNNWKSHNTWRKYAARSDINVQRWWSQGQHRSPSSKLINKQQNGKETIDKTDYKILSLAYKVLITTQPSYLYNLISVQPHRSTRSSEVVTLSRPPLWSSTTALSVTHHPVSGISFPRNFTCLLIMKTYHS